MIDMIDIYSIYLQRLRNDNYKISWPSKMLLVDKIKFLDTLITYVKNVDEDDVCLLRLNKQLEKYKNQGLKKIENNYKKT